MKTELFDDEGKSRGYYSSLNRVNNLTGKEWVFWTRSVITKPYPPNMKHKLRSAHGGQKPPDLCADIIRIFTKEGDHVLDPMMGVGGVLLGAALSGRKATGIDLNNRWIDIYREVCTLEGLEEMKTIHGDSMEIIPTFPSASFHMICTDVPYWKMDKARRSKGAYKKVGEKAKKDYRKTKLNAFNDEDYSTKEEWLARMAGIFRLAASVLKQQGYLVTFVGDMYADNEYHCLSAELAHELQKIPGLVWKANIIWYDVSKKLHLYGYQYTYIPSMIHQNILVFRKEGD
jgi:DNA modification methylase